MVYCFGYFGGPDARRMALSSHGLEAVTRLTRGGFRKALSLRVACLHSGQHGWNLKRGSLETSVLCKGALFRFHGGFPQCTCVLLLLKVKSPSYSFKALPASAAWTRATSTTVLRKRFSSKRLWMERAKVASTAGPTRLSVISTRPES